MSDRPADYPATPELDRLRVVQDESHIIGAFLEWLGEKGMHVTTDSGDDVYNCSIEKTLADYFGIDLIKVENEKRAVLDWQRKQNERTT
jgi:hypothetical protein